MTRPRFEISGHRVARGEVRDLQLPVSETFTGDPVLLRVRVARAKKPGPTLFVTAAIHGDELNGVGVIRTLLFERTPRIECGTLIMVPVVNVFGFEANLRDMPDGRDLNRCFPGFPQGSLASRFARFVMDEIVSRSDFGIDLHSAAATRTNFPNIRGDLGDPRVRELAEVMGCELVVNGKGPEGSLRRAACAAGCPTVILEAGEVSKIEPTVVEVGVSAVENALAHLGMTRGPVRKPPYQLIVRKTTWVRAELGGLLRFHVAPGDLVRSGQPLATNQSMFGVTRTVIIAPIDGVVLGMTTHPAVKPGEPVVHLAHAGRNMARMRRAMNSIADGSPAAQLRTALAAGIAVSDV